MRRMRVALTVLFTIASGIAGLQSLVAAQGSLDQINHVMVVYQENWTFDSLYGEFPGANGFANAGATVQQVDKNGVPCATLPQPIDNNPKPPVPDPRFPVNLPVAPFDATRYVQPNDKTGDLVHRYYQEQYQIDGGKMDKFVAWSDAAVPQCAGRAESATGRERRDDEGWRGDAGWLRDQHIIHRQ